MTPQSPKDTFGTISIADENTPSPPPPSTPPPSARRRIRPTRRHWLLLIPAVLFACYLLIGFVLMPYLVRTILPNQITKATNRPVTIGGSDFNPFTLVLTLHNGIIGPDLAKPEDTVDPILSFGRLRIKFAASSIFKKGIFSRKTEIDHLFLHLVRNQDDTYNLSKLLPNFTASETDKPATPFSLNNINITNSRLVFDDLPAAKTHTAEKITLKLPALANVTHHVSQYIRPQFSAVINGSPLELTGETEVTTTGLTARLSLQLRKFNLVQNFAYLPPILNCNPVKGEADLDLNLLFTTTNGGDTNLQLEGTGTGHDIWLQDEKGRELAQLPQISFKGNIAPLTGTFHINELKLDTPRFLVERITPDNWAMLSLQPTKSTTGSVDRILLNNGSLTFLDRAVTGGFSNTWEGIHLDLHSPADKPEQPAEFAVNSIDKDGNHYTAQGTLEFQPFNISALLIANKLNLPRFSPYFYNQAGFGIKSGQVDKLETHLQLQKIQKGNKYSLITNDTTMQLHDLVITKNNIECLRVPKLSTQKGTVNFDGQTVNFGQIDGETGQIRLFMDKTTATNDKKSPEKTNKWAMGMTRFTLSKTTVLIEQSKTKPAKLTVNDLTIQLSDSNKGNKNLSIGGQLSADSSFKLEGPISLAPFTANLNTTTNKIPLASVSPLFGQGLQLKASGGLLSCKGVLSLPSRSFTGEAQLDNFVGKNSKNAETINWQKAIAKNLVFTPQPFSIKAAQLAISHPIISWQLQDNHHNELGKLLLPPKSTANKTTWDIKQLQITDGVAPISDDSVTPPFRALINKINGQITDFTDQPTKNSKISLKGTIDGKTSLEITGATNLFHPDTNSEYKAEITDFDVTRLAPYLIPHLGYQLAAGSLAMQTTYKYQGKKITSTNHLRVSNLDPGKKINNGQFLPLAIALLTDSEKQLAFDIPIQGKLSDDDFSYRGGLIRGLRNLLLKTAVTPAALLANLNNNTPPATKLYFTVGKSNINKQGSEQLTALAEIMRQRPQLSLNITGYVDSVTDRKTMQEDLQRKLIARQAYEKQKEADEMSKSLSDTYGKEEIKATPKSPTKTPQKPDETAAVVSDTQLQLLAAKRGQSVFDFLRNKMHINPTQLNLVTTTNTITNNNTGTGNRVEFGFSSFNKAETTR